VVYIKEDGIKISSNKKEGHFYFPKRTPPPPPLFACNYGFLSRARLV